MTEEKEIKKIAQQIAKKHKPEKIILFGSFAWGKPSKNSDVDLLVVKDTNNTRSLAMAIDDSIYPRQFPMDVIVYTPNQLQSEIDIEEPFVLKIVQKGKILFALK